MLKKTMTFMEEVVLVSKVVVAASTLLGLIGALVWQIYARELVINEARFVVNEHTAVYCPKIEKNSLDINILKDTQMLTYLSLKKLLTESQSREAEKELAEIKRRQ